MINRKKILYMLFVGSICGKNTVEDFISKLDEYLKKDNRLSYLQQNKESIVSSIKTLALYKKQCLKECKFKKTYHRLYDNLDGDMIDGFKEASNNAKCPILKDYDSFIQYTNSLNVITELIKIIGWRDEILKLGEKDIAFVLDVDCETSPEPITNKIDGGRGCCTYEAEGGVLIFRENSCINLYISRNGEVMGYLNDNKIGEKISCGTIKMLNNKLQEMTRSGVYVRSVTFEDCNLDTFIESMKAFDCNEMNNISKTGTLSLDNMQFDCCDENNNIVLQEVSGLENKIISLIHTPPMEIGKSYNRAEFEYCISGYKRYSINNSIIYIKGLMKNYNIIIKSDNMDKDVEYYKEIITNKRISKYINARDAKDISPTIHAMMPELCVPEGCKDARILQDAFYRWYSKKELSVSLN